MNYLLFFIIKCKIKYKIGYNIYFLPKIDFKQPFLDN